MQQHKKLYLGISLALSMTSAQAQFDAEINVSDITPATGFVINGLNPGDVSGSYVSSAGDINDDGIDDLIIGAPDAPVAGTSYVIFGREKPIFIDGFEGDQPLNH